MMGKFTARLKCRLVLSGFYILAQVIIVPTVEVSGESKKRKKVETRWFTLQKTKSNDGFQNVARLKKIKNKINVVGIQFPFTVDLYVIQF